MSSKFKISMTVGFMFLICHLAASQPGGMRNGRMDQRGANMGGMNNTGAMPEVEPSKMVGITIYDSEKIIKKIKVKNENQQADIYKLIGEHNIKMNQLLVTNQQFFRDMKLTITTAMKSRDRALMQEIKQIYGPQMAEIRLTTKALNDNLKTQVAIQLSDKQLKKWNNYIEQKEKESNQSMSNRPTDQGPPNGQRTGGGRRF